MHIVLYTLSLGFFFLSQTDNRVGLLFCCCCCCCCFCCVFLMFVFFFLFFFFFLGGGGRLVVLLGFFSCKFFFIISKKAVGPLPTQASTTLRVTHSPAERGKSVTSLSVLNILRTIRGRASPPLHVGVSFTVIKHGPVNSLVFLRGQCLQTYLAQFHSRAVSCLGSVTKLC